jgi:aspartate/methionine/tyrosine aminotransferase
MHGSEQISTVLVRIAIKCSCYRLAWFCMMSVTVEAMEWLMRRFPQNDIISLVEEAPPFDLAESVGPSLRLAELLGQASGMRDDVTLGYGTAPGDASLRGAIAKLHGVDPEDVVVTVGGAHALFLLGFTLCEPGDEVIVAEPVFPLARNSLAAAGAEVRTLRLGFDRGYQPDIAEFRKLLTPRTKLVSLASPQNPTGVAIPAQTLGEIAGWMAKRAPKAWLVMDETYREAAYGTDPEAPSAVKLAPRVVSVASLSKCHGAPGLRIGWAITCDPALREQLVTAKFNTVISCSRVDEALALEVLAQRERIIGERRCRLQTNGQIVADWARRNAMHVDWVRPDAGALCCARLKRAVFDDAAVERFYCGLKPQGVRVAPGDWFGEERRVFRLGFGLPTAPELEQALERLSLALGQARA